MKDFQIVFKGFKNQRQVEVFMNWFEGQGEQDASVWTEENGGYDVYTERTEMKSLGKGVVTVRIEEKI